MIDAAAHIAEHAGNMRDRLRALRYYLILTKRITPGQDAADTPDAPDSLPPEDLKRVLNGESES
jgi:hypothetical protein